MAGQNNEQNKQISLTVSLDVAHRLMFLRRAGKGDDISALLLPQLEKILGSLEDKFRIPNNAWKEQRPCTACGGMMVRRSVTRAGAKTHFLGCLSYPQCKHTESVK